MEEVPVVNVDAFIAAAAFFVALLLVEGGGTAFSTLSSLLTSSVMMAADLAFAARVVVALDFLLSYWMNGVVEECT